MNEVLVCDLLCCYNSKPPFFLKNFCLIIIYFLFLVDKYIQEAGMTRKKRLLPNPAKDKGKMRIVPK